MKQWSERHNELFSQIAGERVTNGEVVLSHIVLILFLLTIIIAGSVLG